MPFSRPPRIQSVAGCVNKNMDDPTDLALQGPVEARYVAFLETISSLRPALHRYCSRMTGSVMDGEDVVQEARFQAYRKARNVRRLTSPQALVVPDRRTIVASISFAAVKFGKRRKQRPSSRTPSTLPSLPAPCSTAPSSTWYSLFLPKNVPACSSKTSPTTRSKKSLNWSTPR